MRKGLWEGAELGSLTWAGLETQPPGLGSGLPATCDYPHPELLQAGARLPSPVPSQPTRITSVPYPGVSLPQDLYLRLCRGVVGRIVSP